MQPKNSSEKYYESKITNLCLTFKDMERNILPRDHNEHIRLLHDGSAYCLLTFCSDGRIQIFSLNLTMIQIINQDCVWAL